MIHFDIRYKGATDSLTTYTLAKDIGLLSVGYYKTGLSFDERRNYSRLQLGYSYINGRTMVREEYNTSNEVGASVPDQLTLHVFPNPFNPTTTLTFSTPIAGRVTVEVFTLLGHRVAKLHDQFIQSGAHSIQFHATNLSSGVYLVRVSTPIGSTNAKAILIK